MAARLSSTNRIPIQKRTNAIGSIATRSRSSMPAMERVEGLATAEANHGSPTAPATSFNLTVQELALVNSFRKLPNDERRQGVLEAMEMLCHAYD